MFFFLQICEFVHVYCVCVNYDMHIPVDKIVEVEAACVIMNHEEREDFVYLSMIYIMLVL